MSGMTGRIKDFWYGASLIGVDGVVSPLRERLVVINQFILLALMITLFYQIIYITTAFTLMLPVILVHLASTLIYLMALLANYRGHLLTGAILALCGPALVQLPGVTFMISAESDLHIFLLSAGVMTFLVLGDNQRWLRYGFLLLSTLIYFFLDTYCTLAIAPVQLPMDQLRVMSLLNIAGFVVMLYVLSHLFHSQLINQAEKIERQAQALNLLANTDSLTQLPNRRRIISATQSHQLFEGVVAIADIDLFKDFNDKYGHACGDDILRAVADVMQYAIRDIDTVGRWGGEEFIFLLANSSMEEAAQILERVRSSVASAGIDYDGRIYRVTVSIGMAEMSDSRGFEKALKLADQALYRGKQQGRNRVVADPAIA